MKLLAKTRNRTTASKRNIVTTQVTCVQKVKNVLKSRNIRKKKMKADKQKHNGKLIKAEKTTSFS